jgi:hypothetical protein
MSMQITASLLGLSLVTVLAGWTIQALQPTPADVATRHYGLILINNPVSDLKIKGRPGNQAKVEGTPRSPPASDAAADSHDSCVGPSSGKAIGAAVEQMVKARD